jgi:alpha-ribazole phosphatase
MKLWLVRHAQVLLPPGVCYGATDVAADAAATLRAAQALAAELPLGLPLRVSPLQRCEQLALVLQGLRPDLAYKTDAGLAEMDFGHWEGQAWSTIPQSALDAWVADFASHRFGGRESVADVMQRVALAWDATQQAGQDAAWITHAGVIRAASLLHQGVRQVQQADQWPKAAPGFGAWLTLAL